MGMNKSKPKSLEEKKTSINFVGGVVLTGPKGVGKRTFMKKFCGQEFGNCTGLEAEVKLEGGRTCTFSIAFVSDLDVYHDFVRYVNEICIPFARIILLTYSVTDRESFEEKLPGIRQRILELRKKSPIRKGDKSAQPPPFVLVGLKCDAEEQRVVSTKEGAKRAKEWGGIPFVEMSTQAGINDTKLFEQILSLEVSLRDSEKRGRR
mmetsp:Transcript_32949/g.64304  ORF Transcript_32949/g.64304 Transcript_32949/m.64304 type:complete len:206 (+) Transcript_32949:143-760(+)